MFLKMMSTSSLILSNLIFLTGDSIMWNIGLEDIKVFSSSNFPWAYELIEIMKNPKWKECAEAL